MYNIPKKMVKVLTAGGREVSVSSFKMPKQRKPSTISQKLAKLEKQVKINQEEWKNIDASTSDAAIVVGGVFLLNGIAPGDGYQNRDGRQITMQSIQLKFRAESDSTATGTNSRNAVRFLLAIDKQSNGAAPAVGDILDLTSVSAIDAMRNLNNRKRFKILMDRRYEMSTVGPANMVDEFYLKRTNLQEVTFNAGTAGTVADIVTGSLYILYCSDTTTTPPTIVLNSRVRFTE